MTKQPDKLRAQLAPNVQWTRGSISGYKRSELERLLEEQNNTIADMKRVFYRETEELRDQLMVQNAENRCLKERIAELEHQPLKPLAEAPPPDGKALREQLRPIVEKLQAKHQQELASLRAQCRALITQQQEAADAIENLRAKSGAQLAKRQAAEEALARALEENALLKAQQQSDEELLWRIQASGDTPDEQEQTDDAQKKHIQEYKQALAAAIKQTARQEETIQALTRQLEATTTHYRQLRAQQMEYLRSIRESFDQFSQFMAPEEPAAIRPQNAVRDNLIKPLFNGKQA